jgi:ADP-ribose pyrophosphatase
VTGADKDRYHALAAERPALFATPQGGIRILLDPQEMRAAEAAQAARLLADARDPAGACVGVTHDDSYFTMLRDAVEFPGGRLGTYNRIIPDHGDPAGVAILGRAGGEFVLVRHFRHPMRDWSVEIPRGAIEPGQTPEQAIAAELAEELGARAIRSVYLSTVCGSNSVIGRSVRLYFADLATVGAPARGEGIAAIERFTPDALARALADGKIVDAFTHAAYLGAVLKGLT